MCLLTREVGEYASDLTLNIKCRSLGSVAAITAAAAAVAVPQLKKKWGLGQSVRHSLLIQIPRYTYGWLTGCLAGWLTHHVVLYVRPCGDGEKVQ